MQKIKKLNKLLPLVAIGTVADCQSVLEPTNRLLVRSGLKILESGQNESKGLTEILLQLGFLEKIKSGYKLTSQDLAFYLSPILNSSGRVNHARLSIRALLSDDFKSKSFDEIDIQTKEMKDCRTIPEFVKKLIQTNQDRKEMVKKILQEVESLAKEQFLNGQNLIWLEGDWSKGIIGLLASRLVNDYNLPVVVIEKPSQAALLKSDSINVSASLRAPEGFSLPVAMNESGKDLFVKYGGHPGAAGFTALYENLKKIKTEMTKSLENQSKKLNSQKISYQNQDFLLKMQNFIIKTNLNEIEIKEISDLEFDKTLIFLKTKELNQEFLQELMTLDPFGQDFPFPNLATIIENYTVRWLGLEQKHVRINFANNYFTVFNITEDFKLKLLKAEVSSHSQEPILGILRLSQNTFRDATSLDLIAKTVY